MFIFGLFDLSNFYLPNIKYLKNMFYGCASLTCLNLSNFRPNNQISSTENMFYNCSSLFFLDISHLKLNDYTLNINNMFYGCSNLKYINLDSVNFYS